MLNFIIIPKNAFVICYFEICKSIISKVNIRIIDRKIKGGKEKFYFIGLYQASVWMLDTNRKNDEFI